LGLYSRQEQKNLSKGKGRRTSSSLEEKSVTAADAQEKEGKRKASPKGKNLTQASGFVKKERRKIRRFQSTTDVNSKKNTSKDASKKKRFDECTERGMLKDPRNASRKGGWLSLHAV